MRRFRFIGDPSRYNNLPEIGDVYNEDEIVWTEDRKPNHIWDVSENILALSKESPRDWEEVFESTKPLHKDTDLGYFAFDFTKELIKVFAVTSPEVFEDIPNRAMYLAKELIKQLNEETK